MNYTYLLRCADGSLYCGWTNDPEMRLKAHNAGTASKYTASRRPVELVYLELCPTKQAAMKREAEIKRMSRKKKLQLLDEKKMRLEKLPGSLTVCKLKSTGQIPTEASLLFLAKTDEEISLVCDRNYAPADAAARKDGWRAFRIEGTLDFSLTGVLAKISTILANNDIPIFAVSTYNTDYILVKEENFEKTMSVLSSAGYEIT